MMKKRLFLALFLVLAVFCSYSYAQSTRATFGNKDTSNIYTLEEKTDNVVYVRPGGGMRFAYEKITTTDTITSQETGKTFAVDPNTADDVIFTLPDAEVGMSFKFTAIDGDYDASEQIIINPQDTDIIRGVLNTDQGTTFVAGDSAISPGVTGDSIELFCSEALYWDVVDIRGSWTDNN